MLLVFLVRLLKAFQIEFSWYRLSSWINLTEQWPLRASIIVLEHDASGDLIDDTASLQSLYDKVKSKISHLRDAAPLLELDRDERKLEAFLQLHKHDLLVADLRIFLPFTINLDPYLRKVLKGLHLTTTMTFLHMNRIIFFCIFAEDQQALEDEGIVIPLIKPSIPTTAPTRNQSHQNLLATSSGISSHHSNAIVPSNNNQPYSLYSQSSYNNQGAGGFLTSNYSSNNLLSNEPTGRRKSIIENIHPTINELNQLPADLLSAFPVSYPFFTLPTNCIILMANFHRSLKFRRTSYTFAYPS